MIEKRTIVDQIEIRFNGEIGIRFGILILDDGAEIARDWHRMMLPPGSDARAQMTAMNGQFQQGLTRGDGSIIKAAAVDDADIDRISSIVSAVIAC